MRVLFIRHAKALPREEWLGSDLARPLSEDGIKKAKEFFSKLPKIYTIDVILSSKAKRAIQTAEILKEFYPTTKYFESAKLNPGATPFEIEILIERFHCYESIALIGHEPDFGLAISHLIGCKMMQIKIKKASVICLEGERDFMLSSLLYPKLLRNLH